MSSSPKVVQRRVLLWVGSRGGCGPVIWGVRAKRLPLGTWDHWLAQYTQRPQVCEYWCGVEIMPRGKVPFPAQIYESVNYLWKGRGFHSTKSKKPHPKGWRNWRNAFFSLSTWNWCRGKSLSLEGHFLTPTLVPWQHFCTSAKFDAEFRFWVSNDMEWMNVLRRDRLPGRCLLLLLWIEILSSHERQWNPHVNEKLQVVWFSTVYGWNLVVMSVATWQSCDTQTCEYTHRNTSCRKALSWMKRQNSFLLMFLPLSLSEQHQQRRNGTKHFGTIYLIFKMCWRGKKALPLPAQEGCVAWCLVHWFFQCCISNGSSACSCSQHAPLRPLRTRRQIRFEFSWDPPSVRFNLCSLWKEQKGESFNRGRQTRWHHSMELNKGRIICRSAHHHKLEQETCTGWECLWDSKLQLERKYRGPEVWTPPQTL